MRSVQYTTRHDQSLVAGPGVHASREAGEAGVPTPVLIRRDPHSIGSGLRRSGTMHAFELRRGHPERLFLLCSPRPAYGDALAGTAATVRRSPGQPAQS